MQTADQGFYATTYTYDGADQLTAEAQRGESSPGSTTWGYSYDHNGNRLTQSLSGSPSQSFTYDAHDKLMSGTAGTETDTYDANGNQKSVSIYGGTYTRTYDDEDRLTGTAAPNGVTDTFTYNGLGLRVGKTDSTGTYSYVCDGTTPGSPVLSDGHTTYTPGLSENTGGTSRYYSFDRIGNLWTVDGASKSQLFYEDTTGFGSLFAAAGSGTPFGFGGGNGCQTDVDTGLVLMGHRYYDTRLGRFISQDPAGAGGNWYAYAGNNPVNTTDPSGLTPMDGPGSSPMGSPGYDNIAGGAAGWAANFTAEENNRDQYNYQVDVVKAYEAQIASAGSTNTSSQSSDIAICQSAIPKGAKAKQIIVNGVKKIVWVATSRQFLDNATNAFNLKSGLEIGGAVAALVWLPGPAKPIVAAGLVIDGFEDGAISVELSRLRNQATH